MVIGFLGGLVVSLTALGADAIDSADNPYQGITERNVFHLNPPPPPPDPAENKPPPPKIFLTGITTLGGNKRALLKATPPAKPGEPPKDKSYMLTEGERQDDLEVVAIDELAGTVKVSYAGTETTLNFKDNGVASTAPAAPGPPGAPGAKPSQPPPPGVSPAFRAPTIPPRPVRGNEPAGPQPATAANGAAAGTPLAPPPPMMTAEEQAILVEMNREASKGDPMMPPLPPTTLTEDLSAAAQEEAAAAAARGAAAPSANSGPALPPIPGRPMLPF